MVAIRNIRIELVITWILIEGFVATRIGGIPEVICDGKTGLLVPVCRPAALAESIDRLIDDPDLRTKLGEAARIDARERFKPERVRDHYLGFYRKLLMKNGTV